MKTYLPKVADVKNNKKWFLVDAEGKTLGRIATEIARILQGKHKTDYTPHIDGGDFVIVINSEKIKLSGNKLDDKKYYTHSGYTGHLKEVSARRMMEKKPANILKIAVRGMLPKNNQRKDRLCRLRIFVGGEHNHEAQKPEKILL